MTESKEVPVIDAENNCGQCVRCIDSALAESSRHALSRSRMITCETCGNKRCPHALDHRYECTGSNEPNQVPVLAPSAPLDQLDSSEAIRRKICNCAGAVGQAKGFLQGVSTCELLLPHQRGAAKQFAEELESRWSVLNAELEQLLGASRSAGQGDEGEAKHG